MSLFGKKKETVAQSACCCSTDGEKRESSAPGECCGKPVDGICCIKVLGAGCKSCHQLYENVYGAISMPALVVNEQVVSVGKVLKEKEIEAFLK